MTSPEYAIVPPPRLPWNEEFLYCPVPLLSPGAKGVIQAAVYHAFGFYLPDDWNWSWEVKKGLEPLVGTFPTRLKGWLWKTHKIKATKEVLAKIADLGESAHRQYPNIAPMRFRLTQEIDWRAGHYGDNGSCFIGDGQHGNILTSLVRGGGGALLRYTVRGEGEYDPQGRCWIMPTKYGFLLCNFRDKQTGRDGSAFGNALSQWLGIGPDVALGATVSNSPDGNYHLYTDGGGEHLVGYNADCSSRVKHASRIYMYLPVNSGSRSGPDWEAAHKWSPPDYEDPWSEDDEEEEE